MFPSPVLPPCRLEMRYNIHFCLSYRVFHSNNPLCCTWSTMHTSLLYSHMTKIQVQVTWLVIYCDHMIQTEPIRLHISDHMITSCMLTVVSCCDIFGICYHHFHYHNTKAQSFSEDLSHNLFCWPKFGTLSTHKHFTETVCVLTQRITARN